MTNRLAPEVIRVPINAAQQKRLDTLAQQIETIAARRAEAVSAIIEGVMPLDGLEKHHLAIEAGHIVLTPPPQLDANGVHKPALAASS